MTCPTPTGCRPNDVSTERGAALGGDDWGALPDEPCRHCRRTGGVEFLSSNHPLDQHAQQVRCRLCGRAWEADSPSA